MKKTSLLLILLVCAALFTSCSTLDVVKEDAGRAFSEILQVSPAQKKDDWWLITAPDAAACLAISNDTIWMVVDASPFIAAGLDVSALDYFSETIFYAETLTFSLPAWDAENKNVKDSASAQFIADLDFMRGSLNFHTQMDHYGIKFGDGNMFEWAKDLKTNGYNNATQDKDIVFALNPEPLIEAGLNPQQVAGWNYAQVEVDENGETVQVWKLLKPVDLA
ncbi:MAG: hypothetical protein LBB67_03250 [Oscillospiraceae bacterium]|jgi:hypothetical protein|nr:hypothetical protein [Oscillospiraceae bacterium]